MTSTERLRELLDERGVEWEAEDTQVSDTEWYYVTYVKEGYGRTWVFEEPPGCGILVSYNYDLGADDAVAVTLGRGECRKLPPDGGKTCIVRHDETGTTMEFGYWKCSNCGCNCFEGARFCMSCGAKVVTE